MTYVKSLEGGRDNLLLGYLIKLCLTISPFVKVMCGHNASLVASLVAS